MRSELLLTFGALIAIAAMDPSGARTALRNGHRAVPAPTLQEIAVLNVCAAYEIAECPEITPPRPGGSAPEPRSLP